MTGENAASAPALLPILEYIRKTYLLDVTEPGGGSTANADELLATLKVKQKNREEAIQYLRSLTPFQRHILEAGKAMLLINSDMRDAMQASDAAAMTKGFFRIAQLIVNLKLWRHIDFPIEKLEKEIHFEPEEQAFLDRMLGMDLPLDTSRGPVPDAITTLREADVDKRHLIQGDKILDDDYDEPLRIKLRDAIREIYGVERVSDFSGTKKPLPPNQHLQPARVREEVPDMTYFHGLSQFLVEKFRQLRTATYRPLDVERKETGGYRQKRAKFSLEGDSLVENDRGMISAAIHYLTPQTIWQKMVEDIKLFEQTLTMGAKKIDKDYYFNIFYHIQKPIGALAEDMPEDAEAPKSWPRFEPSKATEPFKYRDRINSDQAALLISELAKCDQYVFGGHLDLDLYLDGIGIRKKPGVLLIEGEGLASFDYINNLILMPTICPPKVSPIDQVVSALADFRYALWIDAPKDIFDKQGVGFAIIGRKTKVSSSKPLWQIFPTQASALIKQRAFREYYRRHILSFLFYSGVRGVGGFEIPTTNRIADRKLRQYFDAYIPLEQIRETAGGMEPHPDHEELKPELIDDGEEEFDEIDEQEEDQAAAPAAPAPPAAAPAAPAAPPSPAAPAADTIACSNCGKDLPASSMFCLFCGAKVEAQTKCKACYAALPPGSKFCNICGAPQ